MISALSLPGRLTRHVLAGLFLLLPFVAHYASKGMATLLLAGAALVALDPLARRAFKEGSFRWPILTFLPILAYALATSPFAADPVHSSLLTLRLLLLLAAALMMWRAVEAMGESDRRFLARAIALSGIVLLGLVAADLTTNLAVMRWLKNLKIASGSNDYLTYINNGIALLAFLAPLYALAIGRSFGKTAAGLYLAAALAAVISGNATTPLLGLLLAAGAFASVMWLGRAANRLIGLVFVAGVLVMPLALDRFFEHHHGLGGFEQDYGWSSVHRFHIWAFANERIAEKPLLGWGLDSSRDIPGGHDKIPGFQEVEYMPLHPHNGALQVRMELGLLGAVLFALVLWRISRRIEHFGHDKLGMAVLAGIFAAYGGQGMLSFGLWQNWWLSSLAVSALIGICLIKLQVTKTQGAAEIVDCGDYRSFSLGGQAHKTTYSKNVLERIVARKGPDRALAYLTHRTTRSAYVRPLAAWLNAGNKRDLKVLEVGCEAGHVTEFLNDQPFVGTIVAFDVDRAFAEITELKRQEMRLGKVERVDHLTSEQTRSLPYPDNHFDLILVLAVVEHLPFEDRYRHVDEMWKKLKPGGLIAFLDTPNRHYPFESHSVGLPFISRLNPQLAFLYTRLCGKLNNVAFTEFMRPGTGWRNATYHECLPRNSMVEVQDISREAGYGFPFFIRFTAGRWRKGLKLLVWGPWAWLAARLGVPFEFFVPNLQLVFRKARDFENPAE